MPNSLSSTGLTTATQSELLSNFTAAFQQIYGSDINLSSDTPDGQRINLFIQSILDVEDLLTQVYNTFDPDNAIGTVLDQRVAINGIQRQGGTFTITNVTVTTTGAATLSGLDQTANQVYTVQDSAGNQYQLLTTTTLASSGDHVLAFQATIPGAINPGLNTITIQATVVIAVSTVTNPTAPTIVGTTEETDAALKIRRQASVANSSQGYLQGLLGSLENINGITAAYVYENTGSNTDANGVPGHSIWVIVSGSATPTLAAAWSSTVTYAYGQLASSGANNYISWQNSNLNNAVTNPTFWGVYNPVAETIYAKRNAGCGMKGGTSYIVTQIDGSFFQIYYDTVITQEPFFIMRLSSINGTSPPNMSGILTGLTKNFVPGVAQEININQISTQVQDVDSNTLVTWLIPTGLTYSQIVFTNPLGLTLASTQTLALSGVAASGTFKITYGVVSSASINWNDSISTIQTKVQAVTGLSSVTVTGSIASQSLVFNLSSIITGTSPILQSLLEVTSNSLMTSVPAAITFTYNETCTNTLTPSAKNNQFLVNENNIILLPMMFTCSVSGTYTFTSTNNYLDYFSVTIVHTGTATFTALGGYGTPVYSISTGTGGTINSSTGAYTAGSAGTDTITGTDALGNTCVAIVTVT